MLAGLCRLTGAQVGVGGEIRLVGPEQLVRAVGFEDVGWPSPSSRALYWEWLRNAGPSRHPLTRRFHGLAGRLVTRRREQVLDDRAWYGDAFFNENMRPGGLDDGIISKHLTPAGALELVLNRPLGAARFGRRECRLVHLFHAELAPHLSRSLATSQDPDPAGLAPRVRQTLEALLEGDGEKQVALRLGLSVPTVHEYVTALYRHFGVSSRAELLASFLRRARGRPPRG